MPGSQAFKHLNLLVLMKLIDDSTRQWIPKYRLCGCYPLTRVAMISAADAAAGVGLRPTDISLRVT